MMDVLKGNFKTRNTVKVESNPAADLEEKFEREALKRLGGSIAFVSRKKIDWDLNEKPDTDAGAAKKK